MKITTGIGLLLALALAGGCKAKDEPAPSTRPAPMAVAERERATSACGAYVAALCKCAQARPADQELAKRCRLDTALPEAFVLTLSIDDDPTAPRGDVLRAQDQARKVVKTCLEGVNQLAAQGCAP